MDKTKTLHECENKDNTFLNYSNKYISCLVQKKTPKCEFQAALKSTNTVNQIFLVEKQNKLKIKSSPKAIPK